MHKWVMTKIVSLSGHHFCLSGRAMTWAFRTFQCVELFKSQLGGVSLGKPGEKHP